MRTRAVASAFAAIEKVQRLMSYFEFSSDVSRLNREARKSAVRVDEWTWQVLARSEEFSIRSGGAFDITVAPFLSRWGYLPNGYKADPNSTFRDIVLIPGRMVRFVRPLAIDLGGIAKGFAVDCAVEALQANGIKSGIVNAGGDLRIFGPEPQQIYLRDPTNPGASAGAVSLRNRAIATSGVYFSLKVWSDTVVSPLIDSTTGRPVVRDISVAVSAPNCLTADALTKILVTRGEAARDLLRWFKADAVILERNKMPRVVSAHATQFRQAQ